MSATMERALMEQKRIEQLAAFVYGMLQLDSKQTGESFDTLWNEFVRSLHEEAAKQKAAFDA